MSPTPSITPPVRARAVLDETVSRRLQPKTRTRKGRAIGVNAS